MLTGGRGVYLTEYLSIQQNYFLQSFNFCMHKRKMNKYMAQLMAAHDIMILHVGVLEVLPFLVGNQGMIIVINKDYGPSH